MGPNGSGKSTSPMRSWATGHHGDRRLDHLDGVELVGMPSWQRARAGLFLALQQPIEVPGVSLEEVLTEANPRTIPRVRRERLREEAAPSASTSASCHAPSTSTSQAASASATRWSSSACCGRPSACSTRSTRASTSTRSARWRAASSPPPCSGAGRGGDHPLQPAARGAARRHHPRPLGRSHRGHGGPELAQELETTGTPATRAERGATPSGCRW